MFGKASGDLGFGIYDYEPLAPFCSRSDCLGTHPGNRAGP